MAKKAEQLVYEAMKRHAPDRLRLERVENGLAAGIPDVHALLEGKTIWFELKVLQVPKMPSTPIVKTDTFEVDQVKWHRSYSHHGGISFAIARDNQMQLYLIPGRDIPPNLQLTPSANAPRTRLQAYTHVVLKRLYGVPDWQYLFMKAFGFKE